MDRTACLISRPSDRAPGQLERAFEPKSVVVVIVSRVTFSAWLGRLDVLGWLSWLGWLGRWADCVETLQTQFVVEQRHAMGRPLLDVDYACHNFLTDAHRTCDKFVSLCADA